MWALGASRSPAGPTVPTDVPMARLLPALCPFHTCPRELSGGTFLRQATISRAPPPPASQLPALSTPPGFYLLFAFPPLLPSVLGTHSPPAREGGASPRSCQHLNSPQCELRVGQTGHGRGVPPRAPLLRARGNSTEWRPGGTPQGEDKPKSQEHTGPPAMS